MQGFKGQCDWYVDVLDVNTGEQLYGVHLFGKDILELPKYIDRWLRRYADVPQGHWEKAVVIRITDHN